VNVALFSEELWKVVKCQSNLVLAGFLRNIFKYEVYLRFMEVQHGNSQQVSYFNKIDRRLGCGGLENLTNGSESRNYIKFINRHSDCSC